MKRKIYTLLVKRLPGKGEASRSLLAGCVGWLYWHDNTHMCKTVIHLYMNHPSAITEPARINVNTLLLKTTFPSVVWITLKIGGSRTGVGPRVGSGWSGFGYSMSSSVPSTYAPGPVQIVTLLQTVGLIVYEMNGSVFVT